MSAAAPFKKIMGKNLAGKTALIVAVLVVFAFGIVGIPHGSLAQSIKDRIHLGLDLKGGTHLVLEVHVAEAVASATDRDVARIEDAFQKAGITGATVGKTDPARPQTIVVSGILPAKLADARSILQSNEYSSYDVTVTADGTATLTMKLAAIRDLETRTLDTSIETIRERIDKLGVTEPVIQKYGLGENQEGNLDHRVEWKQGSNATLLALTGTRAIVTESFAKSRHLHVGTPPDGPGVGRVSDQPHRPFGGRCESEFGHPSSLASDARRSAARASARARLRRPVPVNGAAPRQALRRIR